MGAPPVIFRNAYAEPFFAYFSFKGMNACHRQNYLIASLYFALATSFRSNGTVLTGFILYHLLARPVFEDLVSNLSGKTGLNCPHVATAVLRSLQQTRLQTIIYAFALSVVVVAPFITHQYLAFLAFCVGPDSASLNALYPRPWCSARIPSVYTFVQSHYWDVGLWRYWTSAQIPNFLFAAPMLGLVGVSSSMFFCTIFYRSRRGLAKSFTSDRLASSKPASLANLTLSPSMVLTLLPYALHALALSLLLFTTAHVQIALRVLPAATPWAAWAGAALVMKGAQDQDSAGGNKLSGEIHVQKTREGLPVKVAAEAPGSWWTFASYIWIGWSVVWVFVSSVLWLAFLPPA
ncbi:ER membrane glycoprotein subunit of the GPI transamidase complex-like protein [Ceratobasidium sp. UAMH 11750]|nr:ER membrane glycoprotein subunit of the GPI transamidase complex-like protein [Ceratobasidium sp. UAMH 11750]